MRTAAVIGGAGAALGAVIYPLAVVLWVAILALSGFFLLVTLVDAAFVGPLVVATLCCAVGPVGAWLVHGGRTRGAARDRPRRGALLMLVAALGVAAAVAAQPFLVNAAGDRGLPERFRGDTEPSLEGSAAHFVPAGVLLVGAALASLVPNRADE